MIFTSKNLILRKLKESDSESFFDLMGNKKVMSPIPLQVLNRKESDNHLIRLIKDNKEKTFAVIRRTDNSFLGICAVLGDNEILYRIRPQFWKLGYGNETAETIIKYCYTILNLDYVRAEANKTNTPSNRILERHLTKTGEYIDHNLKCINNRYKALIEK